MSLTRKGLSAMGIEEDKIEQIISAHAETVNGLKDKIEEYEEAAKKLPKVEKELEEANEKIKSFESKGNPLEKDLKELQKKYDALEKEHNDYKADIESKETRKAKEEAYKAILKDAGIPEKHYAKILKYSDIDSVELEDGKIKTAADILKSVKEEWSDHIETQHQEGTNTHTPPANDGNAGNNAPTLASKMAQAYAEEHYGVAPKKSNKED